MKIVRATTPCPHCGGTSWYQDPGVYEIRDFDPKTSKTKGNAVPVVWLRCNDPGCGYMMLFHAIATGNMEDPGLG